MDKAYVLINCDLGHEEETLNELRNIENVTEAHGTFGAYDIIAEVKAMTPDILRETITWKIRKLPKIRSTLTLKGLEHHI